MKKIGLTGGIASGKSTASDIFKSLGVTVIDADQIARDLVSPGMPALTEIHRKFGQAVLNADGSLNRAALRSHILKHPNDKAWLEALLHPLVRAAMSTEALQHTSEPYIILDIPLLVETLPNSLLDRILVIHSPEAARLSRLMMRDHCDEQHALAMLNAQIDEQSRLKAADDIIDNTSDLDTLREKITNYHNKIMAELKD
ncbi:MAG: dephospho-CoA kinase [Gammaproteobacteria bacterium CG11_big_fil_rev_8_21_14_0_20_46_22]|nr:MAG: dephospho-CoA kinase [Gammaproteobacteria bacterium CG12_big_fil_rev_8_21_14_0_65_46_12]PIR11242.1 MAG: dephospho-CoA kinase [Gammaproteobacteria bacterium CG11_big_fil_rev_8_21_14_0_20_46_22]